MKANSVSDGNTWRHSEQQWWPTARRWELHRRKSSLTEGSLWWSLPARFYLLSFIIAACKILSFIFDDRCLRDFIFYVLSYVSFPIVEIYWCSYNSTLSTVLLLLVIVMWLLLGLVLLVRPSGIWVKIREKNFTINGCHFFFIVLDILVLNW